MSEEQRPDTGPEEESTGYGPLDQQLSQGVLQGDKGTGTAQVIISAFLVVVVGLLAFHGVLSLPLHGLDQAYNGGGVGLYEEVPGVPDILAMPSPYAVTLPGPQPFMLYLTTLLSHLVGAVAVYLIARRIAPGSPEAVSMVAGMLYACHPLATPAMTMVFLSNAIVGGALGLVGTALYLRASASTPPGLLAYLAALALYGAAAGLYPPMIVLPLLWILAGFIHAKESERSPMRATIWLSVIVMIGIMAARLAVVGLPSGVGSYLHIAGQASGNVLWSVLFLKLPTPLPDWGQGAGLGLGALLVLGIVGVVFAARRNAVAVVPMGFVLSILGAACFAEAKWVVSWPAYLAPLVAWLALFFPWAMARLQQQGLRVGLGLAAAVVILLGTFLSYHHSSRWLDPVSLWQEAAAEARSPWDSLSWLHAGDYSLALADSAETPEAINAHLDAASEGLRQALEGAVGPGLEGYTAARYGVALARRGNEAGAIGPLRTALAKAPYQQEAAYFYAMAVEAQGAAENNREKLAEAREAYGHAARLGALPPAVAERYAALLLNVFADLEAGGLVLRELAERGVEGANRQFEQVQGLLGQLKQREAQAGAQLNQNPQNVDALVQVVEARLAQGRLQSSFYMLDRLLERNPDHRNGWLLMGVLKAQMNDSAGFIAEWGSDQGEWEAWQDLAERTARAARWESADQYARHGLALTQQEGVIVEVLLGRVALEAGLREEAERFFRAGVEAAPDSPAPWLALADLAKAVNNEAQMANFLREARDRGASDAEIAARGEAADRPAPEPASRPGIERTIIR